MSPTNTPLFDAWLWGRPEEFRTVRLAVVATGAPAPAETAERLGTRLDGAGVEDMLRTLHARLSGCDLVVEVTD